MTTLLHLPFNEFFEGSNLATTDVSDAKGLVSFAGTATLSSAQAKYGGKSCLLNASGNSTANHVYGSCLVGTVLSGDFTIEFWFYPLSANGSGYAYFFDTRNTSANNMTGLSIDLTADSLYPGFGFSGASRISNKALPVGSWSHVALVRLSGKWTMYINGVAQTTLVDATNVPISQFLIGRKSNGATNSGPCGHIDDFRISNTALYTADFTPPGEISYTPWTPGTVLPSRIHPVKRLSPYEDYPINFSALLPQAKTAVPDIHYGGNGQIVGTTKVKGAPDSPVARRVRLHRTRDGVAVRETWSDAAGNYTFNRVDMSETYYAVSFDHTGMYRGVVADGLVPVSM